MKVRKSVFVTNAPQCSGCGSQKKPCRCNRASAHRAKPKPPDHIANTQFGFDGADEDDILLPHGSVGHTANSRTGSDEDDVLLPYTENCDCEATQNNALPTRKGSGSSLDDEELYPAPDEYGESSDGEDDDVMSAGYADRRPAPNKRIPR